MVFGIKDNSQTVVLLPCRILTCSVAVSGIPRPSPGSKICQDSPHSMYSSTHSYDLLQWKNMKQNQQRKRNLRGKPGTSFQEFSPSGVTQDELNSPSKELTAYMKCPPGKFDSVPRLFTGSLSLRQPLPSTYQNSRLTEGKVLSTNHIVCKVQAQRNTFIRSGGTLLKFKFPGDSHGSTLQAV